MYSLIIPNSRRAIIFLCKIDHKKHFQLLLCNILVVAHTKKLRKHGVRSSWAPSCQRTLRRRRACSGRCRRSWRGRRWRRTCWPRRTCFETSATVGEGLSKRRCELSLDARRKTLQTFQFRKKYWRKISDKNKHTQAAQQVNCQSGF
jgi:hypothetical protein